MSNYRPARRAIAVASIVAYALCAGCDAGASPRMPVALAEEAEPIVESHTVYSAVAEHFDEHPRLVAGVATKFAAHATDIRGDFKAVREGTLAVVALRDGRVVAESAAVPNSRPGIFGPVITIPSPGPVEVRVRLDAPGIGLKDEATLGTIMVYASELEAAKAPSEEEGDEQPISFLKEQQWRIAFRNEPATRRRLVETLRVPALVAPRPDGRAVVAAPASGIALPVADGRFPRLGESVARGAVLGSIAPVLGGAEGTQLLAARAELEVRSMEVEAGVERAKARRERAQRLLARAERLRADGGASERELEDARFETDLAALDLAAAERLRAPYEAVRRARESGVAPLAVALTAPIAGTITAARAVAGEHVEGGRALFEVVDLSTVWVEGSVPEPDLASLPARPRATLIDAATPEASARTEPLSLVAIAPVVDAASRSARIIYACENRDGALRIGAAVDLAIETARAEDALAIPESAVIDEDGSPVVFVQIDGESFERRPVTLGLRSQGYVEVRAGLEPGDRVVAKGAYAVRLQSVSTTIPAHGHAH